VRCRSRAASQNSILRLLRQRHVETERPSGTGPGDCAMGLGGRRRRPFNAFGFPIFFSLYPVCRKNGVGRKGNRAPRHVTQFERYHLQLTAGRTRTAKSNSRPFAERRGAARHWAPARWWGSAVVGAAGSWPVEHVAASRPPIDPGCSGSGNASNARLPGHG
jgi:hypothetical protein